MRKPPTKGSRSFADKFGQGSGEQQGGTEGECEHECNVHQLIFFCPNRFLESHMTHGKHIIEIEVQRGNTLYELPTLQEGYFHSVLTAPQA